MNERLNALEEAAKLIENFVLQDTADGKKLIRRQDGNTEAIGYAAAIRALIELKPAHILTFEAQLMADQFLARCSCGWTYPISLWDVKDNAAIAPAGRSAHRVHLKEIGVLDNEY